MNIERIRELVKAYSEINGSTLYTYHNDMVTQAALPMRDANKILEAIVAEILKEIASV